MMVRERNSKESPHVCLIHRMRSLGGILGTLCCPHCSQKVSSRVNLHLD
jgi:hypothetical protein